MVFCFVCPECGTRVETPVRDPAPTCLHHNEANTVKKFFAMRRDYQAEGVGLGNLTELKKRREFYPDRETAARMFLPEAKDFVGPDDPSGQKGLREWADSHAPNVARGNKRPQYPPDLERRVF